MTARWREEHFEPSAGAREAADAAIAELQQRGSPSHDGVAARLVDYSQDERGIAIELQPLRWALRLVPGDASQSVAALCVTRSADGRWLAGRRAPWVASWAGRWALGAGGAVDLGENPAQTLVRELQEEWSVSPARVRGEALLRLPHKMVMFVGQAWLAEGVEDEVTPDHEHDAFAWWPREIDEWPPEAGEILPRMARWLYAVSTERPAAGGVGPLRFKRLKWISFTHSCIYTALLVCAFVIGKPQPFTFVLGLTHGLLWIFMSLACIAAARLRIVSLRLAVAVAVLGGIGAVLRQLRVHPRADAQRRKRCEKLTGLWRCPPGRRARVRADGNKHHRGADNRRRNTRSGRVGHRGNDPRMAREGRRHDQSRRHDRRDLNRQGRRRAALAGDRHGERDPGRRRATRSPSAK